MQKPVLMSRAAMEVTGLLVSWDYYFFLNNMVNRIRDEKEHCYGYADRTDRGGLKPGGDVSKEYT